MSCERTDAQMRSDATAKGNESFSGPQEYLISETCDGGDAGGGGCEARTATDELSCDCCDLTKL